VAWCTSGIVLTQMLLEIADGVFVRQSTFCQSNAILVRDSNESLLIDAGVNGNDLADLADDLDALGVTVTMGFSTHPHWDHLLWHVRLGDATRYGTAKCAATARARLAANHKMASALAPGAPLDTLAAITALPPGTAQIPWSGRAIRILEHDGHAPGHAGLLVEDVGVLVAGDMLSDVEIPLFDPRGADPCSDYTHGLDLLASAEAAVVIPGHGSVASGTDVGARVEADRRYIHALRDGVDPADSRLAPDATYGPDWLPDVHKSNMELVSQRASQPPKP
jgi:glyoxylase-like metal-dependent hydrolase (beta-lactamase superfamily II)